MSNKYDNCEAYVMKELQDAHTQINLLRDVVADYVEKSTNGKLGPELDPVAYKINRPIEVVYADIATRYTMRDKNDGFKMSSTDMAAYLESDEKLKELSEKKVGYSWCKEPAVFINSRTFPYYFEQEGRKVLLDISPDEYSVEADFLYDINEDFHTMHYYPIDQKDEVEKKAMAEFRSRVEEIIDDLAREEKNEKDSDAED